MTSHRPALLTHRGELAAAKRVVVKIGSSSLTTTDGGVDDARVAALSDVLAARRAAGGDVVLVSSGAIAAGLGPLGLTRRPRDLATLQAAASVGQGRLLARYAAAFGQYDVRIGQVLLTADDVVRRTHYANARQTLNRLLELGIVPVVNENDTVATEEIRFGDNDRLAALVAHLVHADALILLTDVDALYDRPPTEPGARRVAAVHDPTDLAGTAIGTVGSHVGTGGMVTKVEAAAIATTAGIATILTSADRAAEALSGADVGTWFAPTGKRRTSRLLWLAHATQSRGRLMLDDGAVAAVARHRMSLLPAGLIGVEGSFEAGDPVDLCTGKGHTVARGLVNYSVAELPKLMGRSTRDLARELGPGYEREVVHRDDLVVLRNFSGGVRAKRD
ncbi:MAG: glutamate 5-kinase [Actinomycetota bacterium]